MAGSNRTPELDGTAVIAHDEHIALAPVPGGDFYLVIFSAGERSVVPLNELGTRVVGRSADCDVPIDDDTISRRHLAITTTATSASISDLGSANGTRVNGRRVDSAVIAPGDVVSLGRTQILLERRRGPTIAEALAADAFHRRLAAEVDRSTRYHNPVSVALVARPDDTLSDVVVSRIAAAARSIDSVARLDEHTVAMLMPELHISEGYAVTQSLLAAAQQADARAGVAAWPEDAYTAAELLAAAQGAVDHAAPASVAMASEAVYIHEAKGARFVFAEPSMLRVVSVCRRLGPTELPVLITGETGAGKEIVARLLHDLSARAAGPLFAVNCAAVPDTLAESELFGHLRGAFSGADRTRTGKLEAASGGTLFLDEIGEMSLAVQAKLLRVLEEAKVSRLGDNTQIDIDVRIVASTNRDLTAEVEAGRFRQDLYYRLCAATIVVPPLRQRPREIPLLARHFLRTAAASEDEMGLAPATLRILRRYPWPGNIRELRNVIGCAAAMATDSVVLPSALPPELDVDPETTATTAPSAAAADTTGFRPLPELVSELEAREIRRALAAADGVRKRAAELLGLPIRTLYAKLKKHDIHTEP